MTATLTLYVNHRRVTSETRTLATPRFLREAKRAHAAYMARHGITEPVVVTASRGPRSRVRLVAIGSGPVTSIVHFAPQEATQ